MRRDTRGAARGAVLALAMAVAACATFERPEPYDDAALRAQAETRTEDGVRVSVALPSVEQSRAIFGIDLAERDIQAVWLEIENQSAPVFVFLPTGVDPEYLSPFEVAFAYHQTFADAANDELDAHLRALNFDARGHFSPGTTRSGFVFAAHPRPARAVDVDLLGDQWSRTFALIVVIPGGTVADDLARLMAAIAESELIRTADDDHLRVALQTLPCCTSAADGEAGGLPLNLVLIGALEEWIAALVRQGYRHAALEPRYVFGRPQDVPIGKQAGWVAAQPLQVRVWLTPIRHLGEAVWIGQVSAPLGGRLGAAEGGPPRTNPDLDEARNDLIQDLFYSQALAKLGFLAGAGRPAEAGYRGDGLRAVMVLEQQPVSLAEVQFFDWDRLSDPDRPRSTAVGTPWRQRLQTATGAGQTPPR
jgi:hypothetical protein